MGQQNFPSFFRPILEHSASKTIRSKIMERDARRESSFTLRQAEIASVRLLSLDRVRGKLGPDSGADTFYILGSGASIEDLTREHFDHIAQNSSVGINNWGVHPFVPDIYSFESVPWVGDGQDFPRAMALLGRSDIRSRRPEILILRPKTPSEIDKISVLPDELRTSVSFYGRVTPATRESGNLVQDLHSFFAKLSPRHSALLLDSGASVVRMVSLGILLGFRKVVLAGVDLNGSQYFWEKNPSYVSERANLTPVNNQLNMTHETNMTAPRPFAVATKLRAINTYFRNQHGGTLMVTSSHSALSSFLPVEKL